MSMTYENLMVESLTDLLENDEVLQYPVCGVLDGTLYSAYLGFTDSALLITLFMGKQLMQTVRIPFTDVKSFKIKHSKIYRQYTINLSFENYPPMTLTLPPVILVVKSQKKNLPCFIELLKTKLSDKKMPELKELVGEKIRFQHFNLFIYIILSFIPMPFIFIFCAKLQNITFTTLSYQQFIAIYCYILAPLIVLSVLNRFFFGKIICVAQDEGLYLENTFILWKDIEKITFCPEFPYKFHLKYTYAVISVKSDENTEYSVNILHFPAYGLRKIKNYNPDIKIKWRKRNLFSVLIAALIPTLVSFVIPFLP